MFCLQLNSCIKFNIKFNEVILFFQMPCDILLKVFYAKKRYQNERPKYNKNDILWWQNANNSKIFYYSLVMDFTRNLRIQLNTAHAYNTHPSMYVSESFKIVWMCKNIERIDAKGDVSVSGRFSLKNYVEEIEKIL